MKLLIFDTETTGLPLAKTVNKELLDKWPYIVQLSYILYDTDKTKLLGTYDWIIKLPENVQMSDEVINIHGITNEISQTKGFDIRDALEQFISDCKQSDLIVAHNISFDLKMIQAEMLRHQEEYRFIKYTDFYNMINKKLY